jgi:hypothetical protein
MHINNIHQYLMEAGQDSGPLCPGDPGLLTHIQKPYLKFQYCYIKSNLRPCFMCKFFNKGGAPPIGVFAARLPPGGQQHHI